MALTNDARSPRLKRRLEERLAEPGGKLLLTFLTAGFPDPGQSLSILTALAKGGVVDILEIGVPFSDPLADGPTIQASSERALGHGMTLKKVFEMAGRVREKAPEVPILLMGYLNPFLNMGAERLAERALVGVEDNETTGLVVSVVRRAVFLPELAM